MRYTPHHPRGQPRKASQTWEVVHSPDENPYQSPTDLPVSEANPLSSTTAVRGLLGVWILEGGVKALLLFGATPAGLWRMATQSYLHLSTLTFLLSSMFFLVETAGPWIGIYYLTGSRIRQLGFEAALWKSIKAAVCVAAVITLGLMSYLHVAMPI